MKEAEDVSAKVDGCWKAPKGIERPPPTKRARRLMCQLSGKWKILDVSQIEDDYRLRVSAEQERRSHGDDSRRAVETSAMTANRYCSSVCRFNCTAADWIKNRRRDTIVAGLKSSSMIPMAGMLSDQIPNSSKLTRIIIWIWVWLPKNLYRNMKFSREQSDEFAFASKSGSMINRENSKTKLCLWVWARRSGRKRRVWRREPPSDTEGVCFDSLMEGFRN